LNLADRTDHRNEEEEIMPETNYLLVMNAGPTPGKEYPLDKNEVFIGRDLTNDIVINDAEVSRRHARLVAQAGGYILEDLGSTNGTFVNGQRLMGPYILRAGETVTLGEHVSLAFTEIQIDPDATMVSPSLNPPMNIPHPPQLPAEPAYTPPPPLEPSAPVYNQTPPPPPPSYSGQVPQGPAVVVEPPQPAKKRGRGVWIIAIILIVLLLICACGVVIYYIDANSLWCKVFPFIPNCSGG
jgi:predicted component of type VI protein secretion system